MTKFLQSRIKLWCGLVALFLLALVLFRLPTIGAAILQNVGNVHLVDAVMGTNDFPRKTTEVIPWFEEALHWQPNNSRAIVGLAQSHLWAGDFSTAQTLLNQLPGSEKVLPLLGVGATLTKAEQWEWAISAYRLTIEVDPAIAASAHLYIARILQHIGAPETGLADLQAAVAKDSPGAWLNPLERAEAYLRLGGTLYSIGNLDGAQPAFETTLALAPNGPSEITSEALAGLARVYLERGDLDKALLLAQDGATRFPANDQNFIVLGHVYMRMGQIEQARQMYEAALQITPWRDETLQALDKLNDQ